MRGVAVAYASLILVVDDQAHGREVLTALLEPEGYRIFSVATGHEALVQSHLLAPDLILLDVMMPDMDGFEVCRHLRADPALATVPVVMVTALDDQASRLAGIEAGADDFITKPFNRIELRARIRTITRLNRYRTLLDEQRRAMSERARLLWAIEHAPDGYLLLDADERPQDGNLQGWRYLGLPGRPDPPLSETFLSIAARRYQLEPAAVWARWPEGLDEPHFLVQPEVANQALWLEVKLLNTGSGAHGERMLHLQDVTARLQAQRNVWTFQSFVAHKLRTPVTSLLAGTGLIVRRGQASLPTELVEIAQTAYNGANRLAQTIDEIVRYLDAPLLASEGEGFALSELSALLAQITSMLNFAPISLVQPEPSPEVRLSLGAPAVELILTELIVNAHKFHPRRTPSITVSVACAQGGATLSVADDGLTLSSGELGRLLTPYQQLDREFTGEVPGLGLGLAMVAQLCWSIGGTCRIDNRADGPGIVVELGLPLAD